MARYKGTWEVWESDPDINATATLAGTADSQAEARDRGNAIDPTRWVTLVHKTQLVDGEMVTYYTRSIYGFVHIMTVQPGVPTWIKGGTK